ncbi:Flp pilus assembly complex ATPase component TadA [Candidatus Poribacteria bacterium]|nr:Flp pilus assembly complex ATPase component TadA [Candidatus Poribacteria bacterium]
MKSVALLPASQNSPGVGGNVVMQVRLGDLLVSNNLITEKELKVALETQRLSTKKRLGEILVESDRVSKTDLLKMLALQLEIPFLDLDETEIDMESVSLFPEKLALKYGCLPIRQEAGGLIVAMADPLNLQAIDDLNLITKREIKPSVADIEQIEKAIKKCNSSETITDLSDSFSELGGLIHVMKLSDPENDQSENATDLKIQSQQAPVIKIVNIVIHEAIQERASDIHVEPQADSLIVRDRIDGLLYEMHQLPRWIHGPVVSRIKIMADMDIAEKRVPQDGKVRISVGSRYYDLRISTLPSIFGEKVVIRVLDRKESDVKLDDLGFNSSQLDQMRNFNSRKQGMVLVTGPTGSGKSTTLNAILHEIRTPAVNIVTVEDPVEYDLAKITQVQVNTKTGLTFPTALRSILRQDPDVIMVGEIRDPETAEIALRAAMTGHLVLSTLHTNDAPSAVTRLVNLGMPPFLIGSTLLYVLAQRLIRKLCRNCLIPLEPSPSQIRQVERIFPEARRLPWQIGKGCPQCNQRGFSGRIAVAELFAITEEAKKAIEMREGESVLRRLALVSGMKPLLTDFAEKVSSGVTALTEIWSVVVGEEISSGICPNCGERTEQSYMACPSCGFALKDKCPSCGQKIEKNWRFCPYCQQDRQPAEKTVL